MEMLLLTYVFKVSNDSFVFKCAYVYHILLVRREMDLFYFS